MTHIRKERRTTTADCMDLERMTQEHDILRPHVAMATTAPDHRRDNLDEVDQHLERRELPEPPWEEIGTLNRPVDTEETELKNDLPKQQGSAGWVHWWILPHI